MGAAFGIGFIVGPAIGGILAAADLMYPALAAAALSFLNLLGMTHLRPQMGPTTHADGESNRNLFLLSRIVEAVVLDDAVDRSASLLHIDGHACAPHLHGLATGY